MVSQDNDFIHLEDAGDACYFANEVGTQGRGLRDFENGIREADGQVA